jgi:hypothetical protein
MEILTSANDFQNNCLDIYINDETLVEETTVNDNYTNLGLNIKYKYNSGSINNCFNITLFENNLKWNELSTGFIKTDVYTNNLKMDIVLNNIIFIDFIYILEKVLKTMLLRNKCFNKYKIIMKKTIVEKEDKCYFNNVKFNYFKKKLKTTVYVKKNINGSIENVLLTNEELNNCYINQGFYINPVISLKSLFIKKEGKQLFVYPQYFINKLILYTKYKEKQVLEENNCNINEEGYI